MSRSSDRIPCINPRCRRTAARAKFPYADEIICGKCWRALPPALREQYRSLRRRLKRLRRLIVRRRAAGTIDDATVDRVEGALIARCEVNWRRICTYHRQPQRPIGLDGFLQEVGLA